MTAQTTHHNPKRIYVYAGYHELFITDKTINYPYILISQHKSIDAARKKAEDKDVSYHFEKHLLPEDLSSILEEPNTTEATIQNRTFVIA